MHCCAWLSGSCIAKVFWAGLALSMYSAGSCDNFGRRLLTITGWAGIGVVLALK